MAKKRTPANTGGKGKRKPPAKRTTGKDPAGQTVDEPLGSVKQQAFLVAYARMGNIVRAAAVAGCHYSAHQHWMGHDPTYPERFKQARAEAGEHMEAEALRRAVDGLVEPVLYKGEPCYVWIDAQGNYVPEPEEAENGEQPAGYTRILLVKHQYSDTLLQMLLKAAKPKKYSKRHDHKHKVETTVRIESQEERFKRLQEAINKLRASGELPPSPPAQPQIGE